MQDEFTQQSSRKRLLNLLALIVSVAGILSFTYWKLVASKHVTTNNAYAAADIAHISAETSGTVKNIAVFDTQAVKTGDILLTLDSTDAELALKKAEANFHRSAAELERQQQNAQRRHKLEKSGFVSQEELSHADTALKVAEAEFDSAKVTLEEAKVHLNRTTIYAPINGIIAKREIQLGQRVAPGQFLLSIVPTEQIYVNANFKEVQLQKIKIGQSVKVHADIYGSSVTYPGKVVGLSGGTGAAFALIPAQNATGNWIKVVQRLPVRIELNADMLIKHPLKVGLSMYVDVDTRPSV